MSTPATNASNRKPVRKATISSWSWELSLMVLLQTLHPIVAPDFWWQVARGRAVWEGYVAPSQTLLAFEPNPDADWLGGLPWYLLYSIVGPAILSCGVAIAAVVMANAIANSVGTRTQSRSARISLICLGFAAARNAWSPTPALIDLCGVVVIWNLSGKLRRKAHWTRAAELLLCVVIWANFATLPLLGLLVAFVRLNLVGRNGLRSLSLRYQCGLFASMALVGSATPRGFHTFGDSFRLLVPWTCADLGTLMAAGILTPLHGPLPAEILAFVVLCGIHLYQFARGSSKDNAPVWQAFLIAMIVLLLAGSSTANIGPAAMFLMVWTIELCQPAPHHTSEPSGKTRPTVWPDYGLLTLIALFAMGVGGGFWPGSPSRLGWGLAPQLEPTLIASVMSEIKLDGTAYCSGVREAGLLAWLRPGPIRPADVPSRSLLSGRLQNHVRIGWDLSHGWRDQHRRSNGSWGGWLLPLRERNTQLLFIASDELAVIHTLEPSFWKPLALDAPCIPYAFADTPMINRRIVSVALSQDSIDSGEWIYPTPPAAGSGNHFDLIGWITSQHDRQIDLRQARILRAMKRDTAALKVLKYGLLSGDRNARREFCEIQLSLAYSEFLETGQATSWRMLTYLASGGDPEVLNRLNPAGETVPSCLPEGFQKAVQAYLRNDYESAKRTLFENHPKSLYAMSQIALEEGKPIVAARCIKRLISQFPYFTESKAALNVLSKLPD